MGRKEQVLEKVRLKMIAEKKEKDYLESVKPKDITPAVLEQNRYLKGQDNLAEKIDVTNLSKTTDYINNIISDLAHMSDAELTNLINPMDLAALKDTVLKLAIDNTNIIKILTTLIKRG